MHLEKYGAGNLTLSTVSIILNTILLYNLIKQKERKPSRILLLNLGVADTCAAISSLATAISQTISKGEGDTYTTRLAIGCITLFFLVALSTCWLITIDRVIAITRPMQHSQHYSIKKLAIHISATWLYGLTATALVSVNEFVFHITGMVRYIIPPNLFITLILLAVAYTVIIKAILRSNKRLERMNNNQSSIQNINRERRTRRVYFHSLFIILNFAICSTPYVCFSIFHSMADHGEFPEFMSVATIGLLLITTLDPMSYLFLNIIITRIHRRRHQTPAPKDNNLRVQNRN